MIQLQPGLIVCISTRVEGGVDYEKTPPIHEEKDGSDVCRWETTRTIQDVEQFEAAIKLRSRARGLIVSACVATPFNFLLCPADREGRLDEKIAEAQALVAAFNAAGGLSKVRVTTIRGTLASTKGEAESAVQQEVGSLVESLRSAIAAGEVGTIRDLSTQLTQMGKLLEQKSAARGTLDKAIRASRGIARQLKRAADAGEQVASVIEQANMAPIAAARFVFVEGGELDAEDEEGEQEDALPGVAMGRFAGLGGGGDEEGEVVDTGTPEELEALPVVGGQQIPLLGEEIES